MTDDLVFLPIRRLGDLIRTKQVSPVELATLFLTRLENYGPTYNAIVTITHERAMRQAKRAEDEIVSGHYRGHLHGVPYGVKDLLATSEGIPTTWGATPFREQTFDYDATAIRKLEEAGAVLVAKLAMVELAGGLGYRFPDASFSGAGINPWNQEYWTGGSSSGSGAAVSAGLVPFALGSETGGSILSPSSSCGITGMRATYGRVSRYGAMVLSWTLDKIGPLALTADDCGLILQAISGPDPNDPSTSNRQFLYDPDHTPAKRYRLGVVRETVNAAQADVKANFETALDVLRTIADVDEIDLPEFPYHAVNQTILQAESVSAFDGLIESGQVAQLTDPGNRYGGYARSMVLAKDYIRALRIRRKIAVSIDALLSKYDALVSPTKLITSVPLNEEKGSDSAPAPRNMVSDVGNLAGLPAISVPSGLGDHNLPTGIRFTGRAYEEESVLAIARAYQSLTTWHQLHPVVVP